MEGGGSDHSPSELDFPLGTDGGPAGSLSEPVSPEEGSEEAGDGGSALSERLVSADGAGGSSPGWALAMFGEDCFGKDVIGYAEELGQHPSACLDVKIQVGDPGGQI